MILPFQEVTFGIKVRSEFRSFFDLGFGSHFSSFFSPWVLKNAIFGLPWAPSLAQKWRQNRPSGAKNAPKKLPEENECKRGKIIFHFREDAYIIFSYFGHFVEDAYIIFAHFGIWEKMNASFSKNVPVL